ncbi:winged helix-turn-helix transcriptional regulator [Limosilactobacillus sp.]|uniref:winged helix-turn-helix transcriptional regulator n=1 Tax=Limosilactobacillus sp. TaxID=2773925 RepID=UPI003F0AFAB6
MAAKSKESGLKYATNILQDRCQTILIFWLGFRPLTMDELIKLFPEVSEETLVTKLRALQNLRVVNPIRDTADCYSLTDDGDQLRRLMNSLSVWGVQQQDQNADRQSMLIIEPELTANIKDLVKYRKTVEQYL